LTLVWSRSKHRENYIYVAASSPECRVNHDIKIANRSFENLAHFKYLGMTVMIPNQIQGEIKWRLNIQNYNFACGSVWV
jgi:hypothetical protein